MKVWLSECKIKVGLSIRGLTTVTVTVVGVGRGCAGGSGEIVKELWHGIT